MTSHQLSLLASWIPIVVSWVSLLLTGIYIVLTGRMVQHMRDAREPSVYADVELTTFSSCTVVVGNCGESPAFNVKLSFSNPSPLLDINNISSADKTLAKRPITFLAPKSKLKFMGGSIDEALQDRPDFIVTINYENEEGKKFARTCCINVLNLQNLLFETYRDPSHEIADAIRESDRTIQFSVEQIGQYAMGLENSKDNRQRVACPFCAELVLPEAKKCHFCQETIKHIDLGHANHVHTDEVRSQPGLR